MNHVWRCVAIMFVLIVLCLLLGGCSGDAPWRYNPGAPDRPVGLAATADNGQVALSWPEARNAAAYNIYYLTSSGVSRASGMRIATVVSTSHILTGLENGTTYYFVVTAVNSAGESAESDQVAATPALSGSIVQRDLEGTWHFNVLVSGTGAGWMRGTLSVDSTGAVTFGSFLDSRGATQPPADLFPALFTSSDGQIRDAVAKAQAFQGTMAASRKLIVGTTPPNSATRMLAILQKQVPGVAFSNSGDIQGFGNAGGGGRRFIYQQIASGSNQEWEFAAGQIGRDQKILYTTFSAPSNPVKPGDKASMLNISTDGIVIETRTSATPQPAAVIDRGIMSADKAVIVGTATDTSGGTPRYILRIYQLVTITPNDPNSFIPADFAGTYELSTLQTGSGSLTAAARMTIDAGGTAVFSTYADSNGATALPPAIGLTMDGNGLLGAVADVSLLGKLAYFKEMFVVTRTEATGASSLGIALKR